MPAKVYSIRFYADHQRRLTELGPIIYQGSVVNGGFASRDIYVKLLIDSSTSMVRRERGERMGGREMKGGGYGEDTGEVGEKWGGVVVVWVTPLIRVNDGCG